MKKLAISLIICMTLSTMPAHTAYGGWKENYRNKYSKETVDPNSERARKIRRLCNFDCEFVKRKTADERKALGVEPKTSLSANLMPWRRKGEEKDKFESYTSNVSPKIKDLPEEGGRGKTGNTLTGCLRSISQEVATETNTMLRRGR